MENNSRKGIFYGLVGVATLVVAIIGATYAYFSVTQTSEDYLYGKAATAGLNVNVDVAPLPSDELNVTIPVN